MVRIRLTRRGAKKKPFYRLIVADQRCKRDGRFIEQVGYYDPMKQPYDLKIALDRVDHWIAQGAQPSDTVARLIERARNGGPPPEAPKAVEATPAEPAAVEA